MEKLTKISVLSPVYRGESMLHELVQRCENACKQVAHDYEIILVDDFSPDNSWLKMKQMALQNHRIKAIKLSRNFGQQYAIYTGLCNMAKSSEFVCVLDCDLQDSPEEIISFVEAAQHGNEVVIASRKKRKDPFFKRLTSNMFNAVLSFLTGVPQSATTANFGLYSRKVVDVIISMPEKTRYFPTQIQWVGFRKTEVDVTREERADGSSGYSFGKLLNLAFDVILANSDKPMRLLASSGIVICALSMFYAAYTIVKYLIGGIHVPGYASLQVTVIFFSGFIIFAMGVLGMYIAKIFDQVKGRPSFIVEEKINLDEN